MIRFVRKFIAEFSVIRNRHHDYLNIIRFVLSISETFIADFMPQVQGFAIKSLFYLPKIHCCIQKTTQNTKLSTAKIYDKNGRKKYGLCFIDSGICLVD